MAWPAYSVICESEFFLGFGSEVAHLVLYPYLWGRAYGSMCAGVEGIICQEPRVVVCWRGKIHRRLTGRRDPEVWEQVGKLSVRFL